MAHATYIPRALVGERLPQTADGLCRAHQSITTFDNSDPANPIVGDCWRTAIACILGRPRDEVPHFIANAWRDPDPGRWWKAAQEWLGGEGFALRHFEAIDHARPWGKFLIATGRSPRGDWHHSVVIDADTMEVVHDPHPSGAGVEGPFLNFEAILPLGVEDEALRIANGVG